MFAVTMEVLTHHNRRHLVMYTNSDVAQIFDVCVRAIQNWISAGRLTPRDLPGRWRFFPQDLEDFLSASASVKPESTRPGIAA